MKPPLVRRLTILVLLALLGAAAPGDEGPRRTGPQRESAERSPFLDKFLSHERVTVSTKTVEWASAVGRLRGLLATSDRHERAAGMILIDAGISGDFAKRTAGELAEIGYVVLVVDLGGGVRDETQHERELVRLTSAVRWLRRRGDVFPDRIGVVGWNNSAQAALKTAAAGSLQAAVLIDPKLPLSVDADVAPGLRGAAVVVVRGTAGGGSEDGESLAKLTQQLADAGATRRMFAFDKVKAGFMGNGPAAAFDADAADRAWFEVYEFLDEHVEDADLKHLAAASDTSDGKALHPFATIADLMRSVNAPTGVRGSLVQSLSEEPDSAKEWQEARARAALMSDSAALLVRLKPGKGKLTDWKRHVDAYRDAASAVAAAADQRDFAAARKGLERLNKSCAACHVVHR